VIGRTSNYGAGSFDWWILKMNPTGDELWQKTYGGYNSDEPFSIIESNDNNLIIVGITRSYGAGDFDGWIIKIDPEGLPIWQKSYGGDYNDFLISIDETPSGEFLVVGTTQSFGFGGQDAWAMKLSQSGDIIWQNTYGGLDNDVGAVIEVVQDSQIIIGGETRSFSVGGFDYWIVKLDSYGNVNSCTFSKEVQVDLHDTTSEITNTAITLQDIVSETTAPLYTLKDTSANKFLVCSSYSVYTPFIVKN
jgi:hypothetical protein